MPGKIEGAVSEIDATGNLITNITADQLRDVPTAADRVRITCGDHETFGLFRAYSEQPEMTLMARVGADGRLRLAIVGESASLMLGERVGAKVTVAW